VEASRGRPDHPIEGLPLPLPQLAYESVHRMFFLEKMVGNILGFGQMPLHPSDNAAGLAIMISSTS